MPRVNHGMCSICSVNSAEASSPILVKPGGALSQRERRTTMTSLFGLNDSRMGTQERHSRQQRTSSAIELIEVSRS